jgi:thioesterase DpgC
MNQPAANDVRIAAKAIEELRGAGLSGAEASQWQQAQPRLQGDFGPDAAASSRFFAASRALLGKLPAKPKRNEREAAAAQSLLSGARAAREAFLSRHVAEVYSQLTAGRSRFVLAHDLPYAAARLIDGLTPTREQVAAEAPLLQGDKDGAEIDQGIFLAQVLANEDAGMHLCHAMLLPRAESIEKLRHLQQKGSIDLGTAAVETVGKASWVTMKNPRYLNAEDEATVDPVEQAVDLALLDSRSAVAVLRGGFIDHPKYKGRRTFCTGINLTHLYQGKISYLWYIKREMGFVNKMFRGLAFADRPADDVFGSTLEKPWICQLDSFAIGGGCQYLLATDYVVAGSDAYMTLPARKEGIVPGAANLRLTRFVGDRMARQLVMMDKRLECASAEGRLICDRVVAPDQVETVVREVVERIISSGVVSAASNRRAFRMSQEPLNLFRQYMAVYARDQVFCHFSPALIKNLEMHWKADQRRD